MTVVSTHTRREETGLPGRQALGGDCRVVCKTQ